MYIPYMEAHGDNEDVQIDTVYYVRSSIHTSRYMKCHGYSLVVVRPPCMRRGNRRVGQQRILRSLWWHRSCTVCICHHGVHLDGFYSRRRRG